MLFVNKQFYLFLFGDRFRENTLHICTNIVCVCVCVCACVRACVCACVYMCIYIYIISGIYVYIYSNYQYAIIELTKTYPGSCNTSLTILFM